MSVCMMRLLRMAGIVLFTAPLIGIAEPNVITFHAKYGAETRPAPAINMNARLTNWRKDSRLRMLTTTFDTPIATRTNTESRRLKRRSPSNAPKASDDRLGAAGFSAS